MRNQLISFVVFVPQFTHATSSSKELGGGAEGIRLSQILIPPSEMRPGEPHPPFGCVEYLSPASLHRRKVLTAAAAHIARLGIWIGLKKREEATVVLLVAVVVGHENRCRFARDEAALRLVT